MEVSQMYLQAERHRMISKLEGEERDEMEVGIRLGVADDVPYLMRRTLKDLRQTDFFRTVKNQLYYTYMHRAFEHVLTRSVVKIAFPDAKKIRMEGSNMVRGADPKRILGFVIADPTDIGLVIHYCNVRRSVDDNKQVTEDYRRKGIARMLIQDLLDSYELKNIIYTQRTAMFRYDPPFRERIDKDPIVTYNPFMFYTLLPPGWETGVKL